MVRFNRTIGQQIVSANDLGAAYEGAAAHLNELSSLIRTTDAEMGAFAKGSLLTATGLLTGWTSISFDGVTTSLANHGQEMGKVRREYEDFMRVFDRLRKSAQGGLKQDAAQEAQGNAMLQSLGLFSGSQMPASMRFTEHTGTKKRRGGGGRRSRPTGDGGFGGDFSAIQSQFESEQQALFEREQEGELGRSIGRGLDPMRERMDALAESSKESIKLGNELAESFAKGADQGLADMNEGLERYNKNLDLAKEGASGLSQRASLVLMTSAMQPRA